MTPFETLAAAKARPCRCPKDHTFGEHIEEAINEHIDVLNRLESHLGCVVCRQPLESDGRCRNCQPRASGEPDDDDPTRGLPTRKDRT